MTLLGHDARIAVVQSGMASGRLHHAWLLHGPPGVGKAGFAHAVAARLLAEASGTDVRGDEFAVPRSHPTAHLIAAGSHPDLIVLERLTSDRNVLKQNISVDQVRVMRAALSTTPSQGQRRVVIVDAIDDMDAPAANALLKSLEEPPPTTVFLLVSHAAGRLLPTIRSRCRALAFARLDDDVMTTLLTRALKPAHHATIPALVKSANGSMRVALAQAIGDAGTIGAALDAIAATGDPANTLRSALAARLSLKAAEDAYAAFLVTAPAHIALAAASARGDALSGAIVQWERAISLARVAHTLPVENVVFEIAGCVAALAGEGARAKA